MRGLDHPTTKMACGVITVRSHDAPKKLVGNFNP